MRAGLIIGRLLQLIPVLFGVSLLVFGIMHITPGDPIELMMSQSGNVTEAEIEGMRKEYGLDRPIHIQYLRFISHALRGDLGISYIHKRPVTEIIAARLPATIELTLLALVFSMLVAIPMGILSAVKQYSALDKAGSIFALVGVSAPGFWLGTMLIVIFGAHLGWLPTSSRLGDDIILESQTGYYILDSLLSENWQALGDAIMHLILPAITLGASLTAISMRLTRSSMLDVIRQDYVTFARAKGLPSIVVIVKHALRNALIPTVTLAAVQVGVLLSGNMIVETVFGWPGIGSLAVNAIKARNYPLVQGVVLLYAITYVFLNLFADLLYTYLNPKLRTGTSQ